VTLEEAAQRLGISAGSVRRLIAEQVLPATQVIMSAPWHIRAGALQTTAGQEAVRRIQQRRNRRKPARDEAITAWLPTFQEHQELGPVVSLYPDHGSGRRGPPPSSVRRMK